MVYDIAIPTYYNPIEATATFTASPFPPPLSPDLRPAARAVPTLPVPQQPVRRQGVALPTLQGLENHRPQRILGRWILPINDRAAIDDQWDMMFTMDILAHYDHYVIDMIG